MSASRQPIRRLQRRRTAASPDTAGAVEPGAITLELCRQVVDRRVLVTEAEIREAMRLVIGRHHTLIEGAAGVAVAGFLKERDRYRGRRVAIVLCGANISLETLRSVLRSTRRPSGPPGSGGSAVRGRMAPAIRSGRRT